MADDFDDFDDDKQQFVSDVAQQGHLGPKQKAGIEIIASAINSGKGMNAAIKEAGRLRLDPEERFRMLCSIYYEKLGGDRFFQYSFQVIESKFPQIKWIKFKNPIGFLLGILVYDRNKELTPERLDLIFEANSEIVKQEKIAKEDILRYARYWKTLGN